jgi:hypothetical protein
MMTLSVRRRTWIQRWDLRPFSSDLGFTSLLGKRTLGDHNTAHINEPNGTLREVNPEVGLALTSGRPPSNAFRQKTQITSSIENGRKRSDDIDEDNDTPPVDEISFATLEQLRAFDNKGVRFSSSPTISADSRKRSLPAIARA